MWREDSARGERWYWLSEEDMAIVVGELRCGRGSLVGLVG